MSVNPNKLLIYYRKYGEDVQFRVNGRVLAKKLPAGNDEPDSQLYSFTIGLFDPIDNNGEYFTPKNGDDITIIESLEFLAVADDIKAGLIIKTQIIPKGFIRLTNRWSCEFILTIENRDFSVKPFKMDLQSFADQGIVQDLITTLDVIFGYDRITGEPTTRDDLGGILFNGTVINKYDLLSDTTDVGVIDTQFGARNTLNEYLNPINYVWKAVYYPNPTYDINIFKPIQQIQIWKNI